MVSRAFAFMMCSLCIIDWSQFSTAKNVQSSVEGDQTVGGVHLFEIHSPSGGMGLGVKFLLVLVAVGFIVYWCLRRKAKRFKRSFAGQALQTVSSMVPQQQAPQFPPGSPNAQVAIPQAPPMFYPLAPVPKRQKHRHRDYTSDSDSMVYIPKSQRPRRGSQ